MSDFLKSFVIGASPFVFIPFYIAVKNMPELDINLQLYPLEVSLYFGIMNVLATYFGKKYNLLLFQRLVLITILSIIIIWTLITIIPYNFKTYGRYITQYILVMISHTIAYLVIIYNLELLL